MQMAVIELEKNISYIEPTQNPLSANVVMIEGEKICGCTMSEIIRVCHRLYLLLTLQIRR